MKIEFKTNIPTHGTATLLSFPEAGEFSEIESMSFDASPSKLKKLSEQLQSFADKVKQAESEWTNEDDESIQMFKNGFCDGFLIGKSFFVTAYHWRNIYLYSGNKAIRLTHEALLEFIKELGKS
ncbi:hypothetical protein [Vibrio sp. D431a]|uniref:hypothetical protein n=1 Tax=Vibrio sp. D431a TaxID=2837388 RepID=UPI002556723A|nr:hypothetical protein [Vibrio sp. D431a]MDK9789880.1 hypothetical protein [Vibrio sp. D431a]